MKWSCTFHTIKSGDFVLAVTDSFASPKPNRAFHNVVNKGLIKTANNKLPCDEEQKKLAEGWIDGFCNAFYKVL